MIWSEPLQNLQNSVCMLRTKWIYAWHAEIMRTTRQCLQMGSQFIIPFSVCLWHHFFHSLSYCNLMVTMPVAVMFLFSMKGNNHFNELKKIIFLQVVCWLKKYLCCNVRKRTFGHVRPVKTHIRLRIRAVWSESSLGAFWIAKGAKFLHEDRED